MSDPARPIRPTRTPRQWLIPTALVVLWAMAACESPTTPPAEIPEPEIASITLASPIGDLLARGGQTSLEAAITLDDGQTTQTSLVWTSANTSIATVTASGVVTGIAAGTTSITAAAEGVSGSIPLTVVEADLVGIAALLDDPFAEGLLAQLGAGPGTPLGDSWQACDSARAAGHLVGIRDCISDARSHLDQQTDPALGPISALLDLVVDWVDRLLNA